MKLIDYLKGKDRSEFASVIGVHENYVNMLCCHARYPSRKLAKKISDVTKGQVTVMELLYPDEQDAA